MQFTISLDIVATLSWFVVKYNNYFVVNLILNSMLKKKFENRSIFAQDMGKSIEVPVLTHSVEHLSAFLVNSDKLRHRK